MSNKTILLIDDEQMFLEPLADALKFEGNRVLKAWTGEMALEILKNEHVDLVTIDIMMEPGQSLENKVKSHETGLYLCEEIRSRYPKIDAFCISVISDSQTIKKIKKLGIHFIKKGETPLRAVLDIIRSKLTGLAYSTEKNKSNL